MKLTRIVPAALVALSLGAAVVTSPASSYADFPTPNIYPISWELKFQHGKPQRVVVELPGERAPVAYWYMTYTVTNESDREQRYYPFFEMIDNAGHVERSDKLVSPLVFDAIKKREGNKFLEPSLKIAGEIRLGEDQARDGVAVWKEPSARMGSFSIFAGGLSGENATVKSTDDKPVILRKTRQLNFLIRGDEVYPGEDEVNSNPESWVMR